MEIGDRFEIAAVGSQKSHRIELVGKESIILGAHDGKEYWTANLVSVSSKGGERKRTIHLVKRKLMFHGSQIQGEKDNADYFIYFGKK